MNASHFANLKRQFRESAIAGPLYRAAARGWHGARVGWHRVFRGRYHDAEHFERLFANSPDPWHYAGDPVSEDRRELLLQFVADHPCRRLLEIGCGAGWMTTRLAEHADSMLAIDISKIALQRAKDRCGGQANVEFGRLDLLTDDLSGEFDTIVCAGVLVYVPRNAQRRIRDRIVGLLAPGGRLVLEHMRTACPGESDGSSIHDLYLRCPNLTQRRRERRNGYEALLLSKDA